MENSLNTLLINSTLKFPERKAVLFEGESLTYNDLEQKVKRFSFALKNKGIVKGDKIGISLGNCPEFVISYFAILRLGAVVIPLNPMYTESEVKYILENSQAKMLIADRKLESKINILIPATASLQTVIYSDEVEELIYSSIQNNQELIVSSEDLAVILYTSGTTGKPKGVMLTHGNLVSNASSVTALTKMDETDIMTTVLPIFHVLCMTVCMVSPLSVGSAILLVPKFVPNEVVEAIDVHQATLFTGVPTMYSYLLQLPNQAVEKFSSIRACFSGGSSLPVEVLERFEEKFNTKISEGYGLSESSPVTAFNPIDGKRKTGSVGINVPNVQNKIVDEYGIEVPRGEVGELAVAGPNVMQGYLGMPEETAAVIKEGWLHTGDLAKMDQEGYIFIVDRMKDMLLVGGYNVYPREVEEVLYEHPDIIEVAVIGMASAEFGETVKAYVVSTSSSLTEAEIIQYCQQKLVKYKVPRIVEFLPELPKNTTGKILKRTLRTLEAKV